MSSFDLSSLTGLKPSDLPDPPVWVDPGIEPIGEGEASEEDQLKWWQAILKAIGKWFVEAVLRPIIQGSTWLIDWIRAELRYWTYESIKAITDLTETTEGLVVFLAFVIAGAILIPQGITALAETSVGMSIKKIVDWTKEKIGNILETVHFVDLLTIHQALLVLWPTWRELFTPFQDAISALAEQLGQGSGYIHAWLSVGHGLSMVGTSLLNIDPQIGEIRAMEKSQTFMAKLDQKFKAYAHDPGLIAGDIVEDFYIPYATEIRDTQNATIESIKDGRDYMLELDESLKKLDGAFQSVIDHTLPEFRRQMAENLTGIRAVFKQYSDWIEESVLPGLDVSLRSLEVRAEVLERSNAIARAKLDNPIEIFMHTEFLDEGTQLATWRYLADKIEGLEYDVADHQMIPALETVDRGIVSALVPASQTPGMPSLGYEPAGVVPVAMTAGMRKHDWFVGEF